MSGGTTVRGDERRPAPQRRGLACLLAGLLLLAPAAVSGQLAAGAPERVHARGLEASVGVGVLTPLALLSSDPGTFATEVSTAVALSGSVTWWLGGFGVGVSTAIAPAELNVRGSGFTGPIPNDLGNADYLAATVDLLYRLRLEGAASLIEPYFGLGVGARRLGFDPIAQIDVQTSTDLAGTATAGARVRIGGGFAVRTELRDYVSSFDATRTGESNLQNDIVASVILSVRP